MEKMQEVLLELKSILETDVTLSSYVKTFAIQQTNQLYLEPNNLPIITIMNSGTSIKYGGFKDENSGMAFTNGYYLKIRLMFACMGKDPDALIGNVALGIIGSLKLREDLLNAIWKNKTLNGKVDFLETSINSIPFVYPIKDGYCYSGQVLELAYNWMSGDFLPFH